MKRWLHGDDARRRPWSGVFTRQEARHAVQRVGRDSRHTATAPRRRAHNPLSETQGDNDAISRSTDKKVSFNHTSPIFNHPAMLLVNEKSSAAKAKGGPKAKAPAAAFDAGELDAIPDPDGLARRRHDGGRRCGGRQAAPREELVDSMLSGAAITLEILRQAALADEKVLVFSQSLEALTVLEEVPPTSAPREHGGTGWQLPRLLALDGMLMPTSATR